jgi:hypothetical protein
LTEPTGVAVADLAAARHTERRLDDVKAAIDEIASAMQEPGNFPDRGSRLTVAT